LTEIIGVKSEKKTDEKLEKLKEDQGKFIRQKAMQALSLKSQNLSSEDEEESDLPKETTQAQGSKKRKRSAKGSSEEYLEYLREKNCLEAERLRIMERKDNAFLDLLKALIPNMPKLPADGQS
jgi:hypothetical protein